MQGVSSSNEVYSTSARRSRSNWSSEAIIIDTTFHSFTLFSTGISLCAQRNAQPHPATGNPWVNIWVCFGGWISEDRIQILAEGIPLLEHNLSLNKSMREWDTWHHQDPSDASSDRQAGSGWWWDFPSGSGSNAAATTEHSDSLCLACPDTHTALDAYASAECFSVPGIHSIPEEPKGSETPHSYHLGAFDQGRGKD